MKTTKCTLTDKELINACDKEMSKMCQTGGKSFTMRVPADVNRDTDLLIYELIERFKKTVK